MRNLLLVPAALLLAACGECDHCKKDAPPAKTTAAADAERERWEALLAAEPGMALKTDSVAAAPEAEPVPPVVKVPWRGAGDLLEFSVWHMHCGGCALLVQEGLSGVAGVKSVEADNETSLVKVTLTDAAQRDAVIARLPAALEAVNAKQSKEFRVLGR
jgi:copper chaperone CopZ